MTRLEIANRALEARRAELDSAFKSAHDHLKQANGQPMNDKRGGSAFLHRMNENDYRISVCQEAVKRAELRVKKLETQARRKAEGLNSAGNLDYKNVANIEILKQKGTKKALASVKNLEEIQAKALKDEEVMSDHVRSLIASGKIKKWDKKPIYYFVTGFKRVAVMIQEDGSLRISDTYPAQDEAEAKKIMLFLS